MLSRRDALSEALTALKRYDLSGRITVIDWDHPKGQGGSCEVFIGSSGGERVAVKRTRFGPLDDSDAVKERRLLSSSHDECLTVTIQRLTSEFKIWSDLQHAHVLPFIGYVLRGDHPCLVSEWMDNGSVRDFLRRLPEADIFPLVGSNISIRAGCALITPSFLGQRDTAWPRLRSFKRYRPLRPKSRTSLCFYSRYFSSNRRRRT